MAMPFRTLGPVGLSAAAAVALAAGAPAGAVPSCRVLPASSLPVAKLEASFRKLTLLRAGTPLAPSGRRRYGVCSTTHYGFETLAAARGVHLDYRQQVAGQDHSPVWIERAGGPWVDEGIDALCRLAPHTLLNAWRIGANCS